MSNRWTIPSAIPRTGCPTTKSRHKFRRLAAGKLDRARINKVIDLVWRLDQLRDISVLMPLLKMNRRI